MPRLLDLLADNPLLLLFAVVALGYPVGRVAVRGVSLGVAAILFAGLAVGALDPRLRLPEVVQLLGLVLFVYSVGLSSGPGFFATLRRHGLRNAVVVVGAVGAAALVALVAGRALGLAPEHVAGLFSGSGTNTPSLAAVLDLLRADPAADEARRAAPVVAYSLCYPLGVLLPILAVALAPRIAARRSATADPRRAARISHQWAAVPATRAGSASLVVGTARVTRDDAAGRTLGALHREVRAQVQPGRVRRGDGRVELATDDTILAVGDLVSVVGEPDDVARIVARVGEASAEPFHLDRHELDARRIFVSNPRVAGHALRDLDLPQQFGAVVTAIRRGDTDWVPDGNTVLQLGDRVRVLTRREQLDRVSRFLGDSYRAVSEFDVLTFSFGIVLGIAVGLVPIPLPGGLTLRFGLAGGPVLVALVLGAIGRTGPLVWGIPYGANLTLRQIGLLLFFAGVGTRSGHAVAEALRDPTTFAIVGAGALAGTASLAVTLAAGRWLLRVPAGLLTGMIAGVQTQPAALSFALERQGDETPNVGYAAMFPVATIAKIVLAQVLLALA